MPSKPEPKSERERDLPLIQARADSIKRAMLSSVNHLDFLCWSIAELQLKVERIEARPVAVENMEVVGAGAIGIDLSGLRR